MQTACVKFLKLFVGFFFFFISNSLSAQTSYGWFKGRWMHYSISPDTIKDERIESELEITEVTGNNFSGFQKIWCSDDTLAQLKMNGSGYFTNGEIHYKKEEETYRKEPRNLVIWNAYAKYKTDTAYFSVRDQKLILHIEVKSPQTEAVKEFAYYRDLVKIPFSSRWQLQKRYGIPKLIDDTVPVINSNDHFIDSTFSGASFPHEVITRKTTLVKTLNVTSPDLQIILLDDAEIDGDIISLYHNNELVLDHKILGKEMIKYTLKADEDHAHHEFILVAENLGSIPPNTALVRIRAGETKYEFVVHSDLHENIKFAINYIGK